MIEPADTVFRAVTVTVTVLLAALLLAASPGRRAALPGALFCLAVAAFFMTSSPGGNAALGAWVYPLTALCVTKAVWFWLFARALFNDGAGLNRNDMVVLGVVAVTGTWQQTTFLADYRGGTANTWEVVAGFGFESVLLVFVLLGLYEAWRGMASDLVERRRRLRVGFLVGTGVYLSLTLCVQVYNLLQDTNTPMLATWSNMAVVTVACVLAGWFLLQLRGESWLDPTRTSVAVSLTPVEATTLANLERALEEERVFLQEGLTIGALARHLGTGEHVLRRVINRGLGYRNFNDFLHARRIREACKELARPEQARLPVLSIAMKVGYGSVGTFNRAFRARVGMTPTDYRRNNENGASEVH